MNLRPYQQQLVTEIRGQYQLGRKAVLAVLPTGGGKTSSLSTALSYSTKPAGQCQCRMGSSLPTAPWT
jgi:superfamily II DNA or RNA helicase